MNIDEVKPISYVKSHAAEILEAISQSGRPLGITQHGEIKAVLVGVEEYQRTRETMAFLKLVALGDEDVRSDNTRPVENFAEEMRNRLAGAADKPGTGKA